MCRNWCQSEEVTFEPELIVESDNDAKEKMCKDKVHICHLAVFSLKTRDTLLEDECVSEEEEGFIQSFICVTW